MGESRRLFPIPAFFRVGEDEFKILKLGTDGFLLEWDGSLSLHSNQRGEIELVGDFIFPYDGYNYIIVKDVRLTCEDPTYAMDGDELDGLPRELYCRFSSLSRVQEEFFQLLVKNFLLKKIISIPSEFMNYTKDEEVRRELLELERKMEKMKKLKKYAVVGTLTAGVMAFLSLVPSIITTFWNSATTLTVKYIEKSSRSQSATAETTSTSAQEGYGISEFAVSPSFGEDGAEGIGVDTTSPDLQAGKEKAEVALNSERSLTSRKPEGQEVRAREISRPAVSYFYSDAQASTGSPVKEADASELSRSEKYYCIQVASDRNLKGLISKAKSFTSYPFVRIEKIGNLYTLRIGFWDDKDEARSALRSVRRAVRDAFFRTCVYKPERWVYPEG